MKIALAQLNYTIGDFEHNTKKIIGAIQQAKAQHADLVILGELAVCGYPPRDFLEFDHFIFQCEQSIQLIAKAAQDISVIVGCPSINPELEGKHLFNSAYYIVNGEVKNLLNKALLPTYDVFDEYRYFEPNRKFEVVKHNDITFAVTVCEDIWDEVNDDPMYAIDPVQELMELKPKFMINISASPFHYEQAIERSKVVKANAKNHSVPVFYCNHVGAQTELIFDGGSVVVSPNGSIFQEMDFFEEQIQVFDLDEVINYAGKDHTQDRTKIKLIHNALVTGVREYFGKLGFKRAILGLSGGIDSALTLVIACRALGAENVKAVMMPSQFSSDHSVSDSEQIIKNLGCEWEKIPIHKPYEAFLETLEKQFEGTEFDVTEENIQARSRGVILMALSNKFGAILLNTTNKSEMAVGYGTLYGDLAGGLSVLADVYKTEVFEMANWINRDGEVIPEHIITKPPSAELRPNQKDSDSLPDYDILDQILYQYIENRIGPRRLKKMGFDEAMVDRVLRLVNMYEFKRYQTAPVLRVSRKAFGMGRRMPIVAKYLS